MNNAIHTAIKLAIKSYKAKGAESLIATAFATARAAEFYGLGESDGAAVSLYAYTIDWAWSSGRLNAEQSIRLRDITPGRFGKLIASMAGDTPNAALDSLRAAL